MLSELPEWYTTAKACEHSLPPDPVTSAPNLTVGVAGGIVGVGIS